MEMPVGASFFFEDAKPAGFYSVCSRLHKAHGMVFHRRAMMKHGKIGVRVWRLEDETARPAVLPCSGGAV